MNVPGGRSVSGRVVVIGLGNPLLGDDGLGLAALERLEEEWIIPAEVELVDGGTWGLMLLPQMEAAENLLLIDAIESEGDPGQVVELEREELPAFLDTTLSPHQVGLRDLFALLTLRGTLPGKTVAMGIVPADLEGTGGLSPAVCGAMDDLLDRVVERLASWGVSLRRRVERPERGTAPDVWQGLTEQRP